MPKVLNKHHQNLRSEDQADKCICLANTQTLKIYPEALLILKLCLQVNDDGNGRREYSLFNIGTIKLANSKNH